MSFMNAKEARPVDDPKALVPFGWAPGGYHCAACSTCGEAHAGSDKRSMRCQDCAEALRDKRANEPAPTRETADHTELVRLAVEAIWEIAGGRATDGHNEAGRLERIKDRAAEILAALKGDTK